MATTGIQRKVDDLGRVVIPVGVRRSLSISEGDPLEFTVEGDRIILQRPTDRCVLCGSDEGLVEARERLVCRECVGVLTHQLGISATAEPGDLAAQASDNGFPQAPFDRAGLGEPGDYVVVLDDEPASASSTAW